MKNKTKPPKYLVCVDAREESRVGLRLACLKAKVRGGAVAILHVVAPADFQTLGAVAERMREERHREATVLLNKLAEEATAAYKITPICLLREGSPGEEIVAAVVEDPEIITVVIGIAQESAGRGTLASWLAGQLGSKLLTPLLMVPGNLTDQQLRGVI